MHGLARKNITDRNQSGQGIDQFGRFHSSGVFDQESSVDRAAAKVERFQDGDFAPAQMNVAPHRDNVAQVSNLPYSTFPLTGCVRPVAAIPTAVRGGRRLPS